jgi:hypothetical protein
VVEQEQEQGEAEQGKEETMDLTAAEEDVFTTYLADFTDLAGDARTGRLLDQTVRGIIGAESLCCARIAAFSPRVGRQPAW